MECKMHMKDWTGPDEMPRTRRCCQAKPLVYFYSMAYLIMLVTCQSTSQRTTLIPGSIMYSNATLVSPGGVFEVGFVSGGRRNLPSPVFTLAIRYSKAPGKTVVWVPDRSMALSTNDATLTLSALGDLQVYDNSGESPLLVWNSKTEKRNVINATIEDTGNLVLRNTANEVVWESFDSPTDTLLPNQAFAASRGTALTAWANDGDWSAGNFSLTLQGGNVTVAWTIPYPWYIQTYRYVLSDGQYSEILVTAEGEFRGVVASNPAGIPIGAATPLGVQNRLVRLNLDKFGNLHLFTWSVGSPNWRHEWQGRNPELCELPGYCGPYSYCTLGQCICPARFEWVDSADKRLGCRRTEPAAYDCNAQQPTDTFSPESNVNWAYNDLLPVVQNVTLADCMDLCLANCECQAVITPVLPINASDLLDYCWQKRDAMLEGKMWINSRAFFRVASSLQSHSGSRDNSLTLVASTLGALVVVLTVLSCTLGSLFVARKMQISREKGLQDKWVAAKGAMIRFTYKEILLMTAKFKIQIGEGGYGTVFKGQIGNEYNSDHPKNIVTVAVKRLNNQLSSHVEKEFLKEVETVGLIHHVHLVSLLGYCAEGDHRLLVYEYVEKGSLDRALFREQRLGLPVLEWKTRFHIAIQTARGLAYLHDDCIQLIIHCDVKPENILLDSSYCAKVADFGLSRIKNRDQITLTRSNTMNIRGTLGYLAPEYWVTDQVSITNKVDVFSYGMVLLEIISGRRNVLRASPSGMDSRMDAPYFPTWAFPKVETKALMDVVDPAVAGTVDPEEVMRALRVAFWCINEKPQMRPSMSEVVQMLQGHVAIELPVPRPAFFDTLEFEDVDTAEGDRSGSDQDSILFSTTFSIATV